MTRSFWERSLWISLVLLGGLAVIVLAVPSQLGGRLPELRPLPRTNEPPHEWFAEIHAGDWFSTNALRRLVTATNAVNPFFTRFFLPPLPPPTKRVDLLYQGCFESSEGIRKAYVRLGDQLLVLTNGAKLVADRVVKEIGLGELVLTNGAGATNLASFNVKTNLEVPAN
jgi:hypothetical protein